MKPGSIDPYAPSIRTSSVGVVVGGAVSDHENPTTTPDAHIASAVSYDNGASGLTADDVQEAIDELEGLVGTGAASGNVYRTDGQPVQSGLFLMRDGTWRDPLLEGDGDFAVGTPAAVVNDTNYNAWPFVARLHDGRFLKVWTQAANHHTSNTSALVGQIGVEELDGTMTWGATFTVYDHATLWVSACGLTVLSSGRVVVTYFQDDVPNLPLDGAYLVHSDDPDLVTWSSPVTVNSSLTSYSYMSGNVLELRTGECLVTVEGKDSGDTFSSIRLLRSSDECETWGSEIVLTEGTRNYYEAMLGLLDDDSILALLRTSDASGDIYQSSSTDGGATWDAPTLAFAGHGRPNFAQLSTGTIIALTRENDGTGEGGVWAYSSLDRGVTWSTALMVDDTMYESEYADVVELATAGRVLVVYGYQPTSALTNSDIYEVVLAEGTSIITGGSTTAAEISAFGFVGQILISDTPSTPLVFADLIQNEAQDDLVYADIP